MDAPRPLGPPVDPAPARRPERVALDGRFVRLEPLDAARHGPALWRHVRGADAVWDYLFDGPYPDEAGLTGSLTAKAASADPLFWAIVDRASGDAVGFASLMRHDPTHRAIEVGNILYAPALQRRPGATEAMALLAAHVFDTLGYRRYEWKCNALNAPSRAAAMRLGFTFEGVFRRHMIVKGRSRDTAWYAMTDGEWPAARRAFALWLEPDNFDAEGRQRRSLASLRGRDAGEPASPALSASATALLVVDAQAGMAEREAAGERRNELGAERRIADLLAAFRRAGAAVVHVRHDSVEPGSRLRPGLSGHAPLAAAREVAGEAVVHKHANSAFVGTDLEARLRDGGLTTLVICGATTNHCVETTARMAGNLGFDVVLVRDACWCFDGTGPDGERHAAEAIHAMTLFNVDGEFGRVLRAAAVIAALT